MSQKKISMKMKFDNPELLANLPKKENKPVTTTPKQPKLITVPETSSITTREFFAGLAMMKFLEEDLRKAPSVRDGAGVVAERAWYVADEMEKLNKE